MIDLRSDTVTRPTEAMLEAMREASLGDDSRDGDATVHKLEAMAADRLGKESAAFMPSGTMTNLVAVLAHTQRGGEVLLEAGAHILNSELGGITAVAGAFYKGLPGQTRCDGPRSSPGSDSSADPAELRHGARLHGDHAQPRRRRRSAARSHAGRLRARPRAWNTGAHRRRACFQRRRCAAHRSANGGPAHRPSICFCVSKGLSAPIGSLLCGSTSSSKRARAFRRMVGGNMRQAGPIAAAGVVALETMGRPPDQDHATAKRLARGLNRIDPASSTRCKSKRTSSKCSCRKAARALPNGSRS